MGDSRWSELADEGVHLGSLVNACQGLGLTRGDESVEVANQGEQLVRVDELGSLDQTIEALGEH